MRAIAWLNESRAAAFYLVKVEAIRIGNSPPAPLLTLITGPSEEATEVGDTKKEIAERHVARKKFWTALLALPKNRTKFYSSISPSIRNWLGTPAGVQGLGLGYVVRQHDAQVELYIDQDKETGDGNREILDKLQSRKESIEKEFGAPLHWETLEEKRACRISYVVDLSRLRQTQEKWPQVHEALVSAMIRLEKALRPHLRESLRYFDSVKTHSTQRKKSAVAPARAKARGGRITARDRRRRRDSYCWRRRAGNPPALSTPSYATYWEISGRRPWSYSTARGERRAEIW